MDLKTTYLGLPLRTPLVPSASPLSEKLENLKRMEDAGASAVVLHSLFEEQIRGRRQKSQTEFLPPPPTAGAGAAFPSPDEFAVDPNVYAEHIVRAKKSLQIPVIASLNGSTFGGWTTFSQKIEQAGADALELNFYSLPMDAEKSADEIEQDLLTIVASVKAQVRIPVAIKLSPYYTNVANFARRLERHGADGLVLFNGFFQPDIDLHSFGTLSGGELSTSSALRLPLRWISSLYGRMELSLAACGGVHSGMDALKLIMAGADVTMLCSVLLRQGIEILSTIESDIVEWMEQFECDSLQQMKGRLSCARDVDPARSERAQYVRAIGAFHS